MRQQDKPGPATPPASAPYPGSAELLLDVILAERQRRDAALDALQTKVGILLGLAAVLVTLAAQWDSWWQRALSAVPAFVAAVICLVNLLTKRLETLGMLETRNAYLSKPPDEAARSILDTIVGGNDTLDDALKAAKRTTNWSAVLLGMSTLVNFVLVIATNPAVSTTTP